MKAFYNHPKCWTAIYSPLLEWLRVYIAIRVDLSQVLSFRFISRGLQYSFREVSLGSSHRFRVFKTGNCWECSTSRKILVLGKAFGFDYGYRVFTTIDKLRNTNMTVKCRNIWLYGRIYGSKVPHFP